MKIIKSQKIAGYRTELNIKSKDGNTLKRFNSVSGVDFAQAYQNCYKRADYWLTRVVQLLSKEKSYLDQYEQEKIKHCKVTLKEAQRLKKKLAKMIIRPSVSVKEI